MEIIDTGSFEKLPIKDIKQRWNFMLISVSLALLGQIYMFYKSFQLSNYIAQAEAGDVGGAYAIQRLQTQFDPITLLIGLIGVMAIISVAIWFYRAGQNIHFAGVKTMKFSPGWYVGWFFIPVVQVVMPYLTTRELWQANASIDNPEEYNDWRSNTISPMVHVWYFSFVIRLLAGIVIMIPAFQYMQRIAFDPDAAIAYFKQANYVTYFSIPLQTIEGIALLLFAKKISDKQISYQPQQ